MIIKTPSGIQILEHKHKKEEIKELIDYIKANYIINTDYIFYNTKDLIQDTNFKKYKPREITKILRYYLAVNNKKRSYRLNKKVHCQYFFDIYKI